MSRISCVLILLAMVFGRETLADGLCQDNPIGLSDSDVFPIVNFHSTSVLNNSEAYKAYKAVAGSGEAWCGNQTSDPNPELTIDLGRIFRVCASEVLGINQGHVVRFIWTFSLDNVTYGNQRNMQNDYGASVDFDSFTAVNARYVKLSVITFSGDPCVSKLELFRSKEDCGDNPVGISDSYMIPDASITANTERAGHEASLARMSTPGLWCPVQNGGNPFYLQIDFGKVIKVCAVETEGNYSTDYYVTHFELEFSTDNSNFNSYTENSNKRVFTNVRQGKREFHHLFEPVYARYMRFQQTSSSSLANFCTRLEVYHTQDDCFNENVPFSAVKDHLGSSVDKSQVPLNTNGWCSSSNPSNPFLQIDFGSLHTVCAVAVQGSSNSNKFPKQFKLQFAIDDTKTWYTYQEVDDIDREYVISPADNDVIVKRQLAADQAAQYIRFLPTDYEGNEACLRVQVYGREAVEITCNDNGDVDVDVAHAAIDPGITHLMLENTSCSFPVSGNGDTLFTFSVNECGTTAVYNADEDYFHFSNTITGLVNNGSGAVLTQSRDLRFQVLCKYDRDGTVREEFTPVHNVSDAVNGSETFDFSLGLYRDSNHNTAYNDENLNLGTTLYATVGVDASKFDKVLMVKRCWTTPTSDRNDSVSVDFIDDSCEANGVPAFVDFNYACASGSLSQNFEFEAFRFPGDADEVYIHCDVRVCLNESGNSCDGSCAACGPARKRRSSTENNGNGFDEEEIYSVDFVPFKVKDNRQAKVPASAQNALTTTAVIAIVVSCALMLAIVCVTVFIAMRLRRKPARNPTELEQNAQYRPYEMSNEAFQYGLAY